MNLRHLLPAMRFAVQNAQIERTIRVRGGAYGSERLVIRRNIVKIMDHFEAGNVDFDDDKAFFGCLNAINDRAKKIADRLADEAVYAFVEDEG